MQENPFIQHIKKQGIEQGKAEGIEQGKAEGIVQGARETSINNILSILSERFPLSNVQPVAEALESIQDLDRLTELHLTAIDTPSVKDFLQAVNT